MGTTKKNFSGALRRIRAPHLHSGPVPPLSNSFQRHCLSVNFVNDARGSADTIDII